jgi:hypothetical protein
MHILTSPSFQVTKLPSYPYQPACLQPYGVLRLQVAALEAVTLLLRRMPVMASAAASAESPAAGGGLVGSVGAGREFSSLPEFTAYR